MSACLQNGVGCPRAHFLNQPLLIDHAHDLNFPIDKVISEPPPLFSLNGRGVVRQGLFQEPMRGNHK